jgi:hypothetical protein
MEKRTRADSLLKDTAAEDEAEDEEKTMRSEMMTKPKSRKLSLTDSILKLCASGRFGVREAIAAATQQQRQRREVSFEPNQEQQRE